LAEAEIAEAWLAEVLIMISNPRDMAAWYGGAMSFHFMNHSLLLFAGGVQTRSSKP
jgi:hypothetical protein